MRRWYYPKAVLDHAPLDERRLLPMVPAEDEVKSSEVLMILHRNLESRQLDHQIL